ncbi:MAG TPA: hypothetical protein VLZ83_11260 [Edaphocola sp.]|nr:hypothetical protein [Edaphocola sp.]
MYEKISNKNLFYFSLGIAGYFLLLFVNAYIIKSDFILIGVFQELLTIPMLIIQLFLLFISIKHCIKDEFRIKEYSFWAFSILLVSNLSTLGSLIITILRK